MFKNIFVPAALIGAMLVAGGAQAGTLRHAEVETADLNLATPAGQALLERRIDAAIDEVCAPLVNTTLEEKMDFRRCRANAQVGADAQVAALTSKQKGGVQVAVR